MSSATTNFRDKLENLPVLLRTALDRRARARIAVAKLKAEFVKLQAQLKIQGEAEESEDFDSADVTVATPAGNAPVVDDILESDLSLINQESKLEHLKLELTEAEDKAEIKFRASESRVTEGHVKAAIGSNPDVARLRREVLEAKEALRIRKATFQRERSVAQAEQRDAQMFARYEEPVVIEDVRLVSLREKLLTANEELILAEVEVEVAVATIDAYKMLSQNQ